MPEWLKGADCKSVGLRLRWFESNPLHHRFHNLPARVGSFPRPVSSGCTTLTRFLQPSLTHGSMPEQGIQPLGMFASRRSPSRHRHASGCSSMVEQKPSKLMTRVRFPSPAPVSADLSPLQQTPERVLRIPLECHRTFGAKPLATRWLVPLGGVLVPPVVGGFLFGDASTMLSASLMGDPVMLLLFRMDPCNSGIGDRVVPVVLCLVRT